MQEKPLTLLKKLELLNPAHTQHRRREKSPISGSFYYKTNINR